MPPVRTQAEFELQEQRTKLANSYQSLLNDFSSPDLQTVGNYAVGRLIGKGSFGKVYLASHKLTNGSKVVLKSANKNDPNLAREIHHHRQFLHPHIARLYEVIVTETSVWLVLEWCRGDELYHHLLENGPMDPSKVQKIFTQLVGAVTYVHNKSCVHRDLKLENILLDKNENVKLVDFGFTREYQGTTSYLQTWCGTVCYSAPEMLRGEKYAGEKVDMWSLGIILYALLCGELPYDEDDDSETKAKILREEPKYPDHMPAGAQELIKKLLSKRALLRPSLADVLKDPWLAEYAPQQQEILKLQQPAPFSTQLEKDTLQRMRSAGVDIDTVIEHVLAQRCDSLAGWWALLIEKEQRKEKRRELKRKERDAESRSLRRLSAASSKLLALGEIQEGEILEALGSRGRRLSRANGGVDITPLTRVNETKTPTPEPEPEPPVIQKDERDKSRSSSRPPPPPKDYGPTIIRRPRNSSRGSGSMLRTMTNNPDLLSPQYVPPPQRKRRNLMQQPLREQLAWVKHWFKEGTSKRIKSSDESSNKKGIGTTPHIVASAPGVLERGNIRDLRRTSTGPLHESSKRVSYDGRPELQSRSTMPARPRINTASSGDSRTGVQRKRQSLSPATLTPHSSFRRPSAGLRGRKSTSSSVSSIRSTYQPHHQHTHSKASSTSSASVASPSGLSSTSGSRLARSPHSSVKVLTSSPANTPLPSNIRVSRRPPPAGLAALPATSEIKSGFMNVPPSSPGLPVFARRKRSVFKGPGVGGSPTSFARSGSAGRTGSVPRKSTDISEMIPGITEEDEEEDEDEDDEEIEDVDQFGPDVPAPSGGYEVVDTEPITPISPLPGEGLGTPIGSTNVSPKASVRSTPLTAEALAKMTKMHEEDREQSQEDEERQQESEAVVASS